MDEKKKLRNENEVEDVRGCMEAIEKDVMEM
jgi:hypothetical protein